jgi:hypothetical protein
MFHLKGEKIMKRLSIIIAVMLASTALFTVSVQSGQGAVTGKLTLLRVHDVGTKYGPQSDQIDVEVVVKLNTTPDWAYGFQLRNDSNSPVRQAMLDLLRDAFNHNWTVTLEYNVDPGKKNAVIFRVILKK